jgi:two-component system response regulator MtrA
VTEHVRRVRLKIETDPDAPPWIETVRGVGYRFCQQSA